MDDQLNLGGFGRHSGHQNQGSLHPQRCQTALEQVKKEVVETARTPFQNSTSTPMLVDALVTKEKKEDKDKGKDSAKHNGGEKSPRQQRSPRHALAQQLDAKAAGISTRIGFASVAGSKDT